MIDDWKATRLSEMIDKLGGGQKSFTDALILSRVIILERSDFENDNKRRTGWGCYSCAALLLCLLVHQLGFALNW